MTLRQNNLAQSTIEFTFAMIVTMFIVYGMVQIFRWAGMDLAQRRYWQDNSMTGPLVNGDPLSQLNANDDYVTPITAVWHGSVSNGNVSQ